MARKICFFLERNHCSNGQKSKKGFFKYKTFENFSKMFSFFLQKMIFLLFFFKNKKTLFKMYKKRRFFNCLKKINHKQKKFSFSPQSGQIFIYLKLNPPFQKNLFWEQKIEKIWFWSASFTRFYLFTRFAHS